MQGERQLSWSLPTREPATSLSGKVKLFSSNLIIRWWHFQTLQRFYWTWNHPGFLTTFFQIFDFSLHKRPPLIHTFRWFFQKLKFWALDPQLSLYGLVCWNEKGPSIWALIILGPKLQEPTCFRVVVWGLKMTKGTSSFGKRRNKTHTICRRCGTVWLFKIHPHSRYHSGIFRWLSTSRRRLAPLAASLQPRSGDTTGLSRWCIGSPLTKYQWTWSINSLSSSGQEEEDYWNWSHELSLIHIWRCRRYSLCRSRWSPYH